MYLRIRFNRFMKSHNKQNKISIAIPFCYSNIQRFYSWIWCFSVQLVKFKHLDNKTNFKKEDEIKSESHIWYVKKILLFNRFQKKSKLEFLISPNENAINEIWEWFFSFFSFFSFILKSMPKYFAHNSLPIDV